MINSYFYGMRIFIYFILITSIFSCASSRLVEPLSKNQHAVSFDLGGSLIDYNETTIPIPLSSITYSHGISEKLTAFGSLHTTSLLFNNFQTDFGLLALIKSQENYVPALSSVFALNYISELSVGNPKLWPQFDTNAYWNFYENRHRLHLGCSIWIDFELINDNNFAIVNPHLGYTYKINNWEYGLEMKLLAPSYDNTKVFLPYQSIAGNYGATAIFFNVGKRF